MPASDKDNEAEKIWKVWAGADPMDSVITDAEEFVEWYGPVERLDSWNEGVKREESFDGWITNYGDSTVEELEYAYDKMVEYELIPNERYAIGYLRINSKSKTLAPDKEIYDIASHRVFEGKEQCDQEYAFRKFCFYNRYVKFDTFSEIQTSDADSRSHSDEPFFWLKLAIKLCEKKGALLLYCELGSIFKHPEFFALINGAKKRGVKVKAVKSRKALTGAQRHIQKPRIFTKKGTAKKKAEKERLAKLERYPILAWKEDTNLSTKRFNTFEHLFNGADPIYKYFLTPRTRDSKDPAKWKIINDYDKNIANELHDAGHLTVEGYGWNKQLARKVRIAIDEDADDKFKKYCIEKFRLEAQWELDDANFDDEVPRNHEGY